MPSKVQGKPFFIYWCFGPVWFEKCSSTCPSQQPEGSYIVDVALRAQLQPVHAPQASEAPLLVRGLHAEKTHHKVPSGLRWWL